MADYNGSKAYCGQRPTLIGSLATRSLEFFLQPSSDLVQGTYNDWALQSSDLLTPNDQSVLLKVLVKCLQQCNKQVRWESF